MKTPCYIKSALEKIGNAQKVRKKKMAKTESGMCPKCGECLDVEAYDHTFDGDSMRMFYVCKKCEAEWDEDFGLTYKGYIYEGKYHREGG